MKSNELRIGNIVLAPKSDEFDLRICKVFEIRKKYLRLIELSTNLMFDQTRFEPIPLTEKWLTDFGFVKNELNAKHNLFVWYGDHIAIKGMLGIVKPSECIYVHQLQNLYFALTGTELTITS